ncbi:carbohydate-binding domain-containing protein [Spirosoma sp. BT702]|uniref:beta-N-acetylhexosaminidase n=1 Tax=Spirosoma profusum TaxID=2771354 RepID=A0A927AR56_9BACT|nr:family 20 glycosylhydrolase [Spirosoma profusum]MBD2699195.1 carbohydate-binding domain-containing protein [Spirosoma profusum]
MRAGFYVILSLLFILGVSCQRTAKEGSETGKQLAVSWELVSNFTAVKDGFEARFNLTNNSDRELTDTNWALFFNMSPRPILPAKNPQSATVQHINGDWYKLVPNKGFSLKPGASTEVKYEGTEAVTKVTDAPLGLYVVMYDAQGKEESMAEIADYTIKPFTRKEQMLRGPGDMYALASPENTYRNNLNATLLPASQLQKIIPSPVKITTLPGTLAFDASLSIYADRGLENEAKLLSQKLKALTGKDFSVASGASAAKGISLKTGSVNGKGIGQEAYQLTIDGKGVSITGSDAAGVFYGIQSLLALIPTATYLNPSSNVTLPYTQIEDAPRFHFRGLHLDVSRNFQTKETILRLLDLLAFYKINHFLFYTTEDEGWRLEIDGLPELTQVGAQREHTSGKDTPVLHPAYGSGPKAYAEGKHGSGFYTKADFIEILKYAKERHIKVIPELNLPGHARAAIKAMEARYQRLMKEGKEQEANEYRLIDPDDKSVYLSAQGYKDNVVSVGRESTYHFYEKVVDEITKMYKEAGLPMDVMHAGGDEVPEGVWTKSPEAAKILKENPTIKDPKNLQTYFFRKLRERLAKRNLEVHAWEEAILNKTADGKYVPNPEFVGKNVVPYVWNNLFDIDLGNRLVNAGYPVVLCNVSNFYFDMSYNNDPQEPGLYWAGYVDTRNNWAFAPYDMFKTTYRTAMGKPLTFTGLERMKPEARKNIRGIESQLWSETVKGREMAEYDILPKLLGFAESAWAPERSWETIENREAREKAMDTGWNVFANTLAQKDLPRLARINSGYNYRLPLPGAIIENGLLKANVELPGLAIRYTTDGSEPTAQSTVYAKPVKVSGTVKLKSFDAAGRSSRSAVVNL